MIQPNTITLRVQPGGRVDGFYTEAIDLRSLGLLHVSRATDIRFCHQSQQWLVRSMDTGKLLFSHPSRERCLTWERENLNV